MRSKLWWNRNRFLSLRVALLAIFALVLQTAVASALPPAKTHVHAPKPVLGAPVPVSPVHRAAPKPAKQAKPYKATATAFPSAVSSTLELTSARSSSPGSPVWAQRLGPAAGVTGKAGTDTATTKSAAAGLTALHVKVLDRKAAERAGVSGVVAQVTPTGSGPGTVRLGMDYSSFAQAYGGDYASRLHLVTLPACALTTPQVPSCRTQTPLPTSNDGAAQTLSTTMALSASATTTAAPVLLAATSAAASGDGGGAGGQYGATSMKPAGSWTAGGSAGSFDYAYPISVPPSVTGLEPTPDLSYDSGSIDGQVASTEAQSSWIGDGWSAADSFVEQTFLSCSDAVAGKGLPSADATGDMCYDGPLLTLSLNGSTTSLIWDADKKTYEPANGSGDVVAHHTGTGNGSGTYNTDYWTVTDRSGTVFSFGLNKLPGWTDGKPTTHSVDTEPVFSPESSGPCYKSSGFADSVCTMAYRWHLDYVTNLHGGAMAYYYEQATNHYGERDGAADGVYVRDSHLAHIDYGFTDGNAYGTVPDKVVYDSGDRCGQASCPALTKDTASSWPDVPFDLLCAKTSGCGSYGPAFFSTVRLSAISTQQWDGSAYRTVDSWALDQSIPTTGTFNTSTLWLKSIAHTGSDTAAGGPAVTLPKVVFSPTMMANRVNFTSGVGGGLGPLNRYRIGAITTETGSVISVTYGLVSACTPSSIQDLDPKTNTSSCFPVRWSPDGVNTSYLDWFNKYVATSVAQSDPSGGSAGLYTKYTYLGPAAWHYDDNELVKAKYRTYGQWRGYGDVQVRTGQGTDPLTLAESWYYRGMDGDWLSSTSSRSVTLTDSQGGKHPDTDQFAGQAMESATYTYDGGPVVHSSINSYWLSAPYASRTRSGLPPLTAHAMGQVETWERQAITSTSPTTWRTTETDVSFDTDPDSPTFGLEKFSYAHGDLAKTGTTGSQETCTRTTYAAANTAINLTGLVAETETDAKPCGGSSPAGASAPTAAQTNALTAPSGLNRATDVISDTRTFYDNPAMAATWPQPSSPVWPQAAPTLANSSVQQDAVGWAAGAFVYRTDSATTYDSHGRPVATYDGNGNKTTTAYTDTSYLTTTAVKATNALGQSTTSTYDPERAVTLTATDVNGVVSTVHSDGLGRTIAVWQDSRTTDKPANQLYSYSLPAEGTTAPVVVTTKVMNDGGGYTSSTNLLDALLRTRQTQDQAVTTGTGRIISDTFYDTHGWVVQTNDGYQDDSSNPNGVLEETEDNNVHQQTLTSYDGLGRPTVVTGLDDKTVREVAYTQYLGDRTVSVPPQGRTATAAVADAMGRTTELDQYETAPSVTTATAGGFTTAKITGGTVQATHYGFDALGRANRTVDSAGDVWGTRYNYHGDVIGSTDPDSGSTPEQSPVLYDGAGNQVQSTDPAGHTLSFVFDKLNRKIAEYDAPLDAQSAANEVASWTYDNSDNAVPGMTYPIGHLTATRSHTPAGVFVTQAKGFNIFAESLGETYTVPGTSALAGDYTYQHSYTDTVGRPKATLVPAAGGMAKEVLTTGYCGYNGLDQACTLSGSHGYVQNVAYDALGQVAQQVIGSAAAKAYVTNTYDTHTGALTDQNVVNTAVSATPLDRTKFSYDPSGNITAQSDTRASGATETQCYRYDGLDRLTQAWTTGSAAAGTCDTAPTPQTAAAVVTDGVAGSAYWTSWSFDGLGQPQQRVEHSLTGGADTSTVYAYGGSAAGCAAASTGAHTLATAATTTGATTTTKNYCYDSLGDTVSRPTSSGEQALTWDDEGRLSTATTGTHTTGYLYDADGGVVERTDPGSVTVFLPDQQITLDTASGDLSNVRSYDLPGGGQAVVTDKGYGFEYGDQHGTGTLALDSTAANPSWQQYTPYGAPRGPTPGSSWLDPNGFLGSPQDPDAELTTIGAREYDTDLGRFLSLDPVLETDSQQLNGYTYASSNPVTFSDPTGLDNWWADPTMNVPTEKGGTPISQKLAHDNGFGALCTKKTCSGYNDAVTKADKAYADAQAKAYAAAVKAAQEKAEAQARAKAKAAAAKAAKRHCAWYNVACQVKRHLDTIITAAEIALAATAIVMAVAIMPEIAFPMAVAFAESSLATGSLAMASVAAASAGLSVAAEAAGATTVAAGAAVMANLAGAGHTAGGGGRGCSFSPDTPVLLADGTTKPIEEVKPGDKVEAADPVTGKNEGGREVQHQWINHDTDLLDVTVQGVDGKPATLHTTANHPFWDDTAQTWVAAGALIPGHSLNANTDTHVKVLALHITPGAADRYNLTVEQLHTFYVLAGATPVLVHNTCPSDELLDVADANIGKTNVASEVTATNGAKGYGVSTARQPSQLTRQVRQAVEETGHHGGCAEIGALCDLESKGAPLKGVTPVAVKVAGGSQEYDYEEHGELMNPCAACQRVLDHLDEHG